MRRDEFIGQVQHRARLHSRDDAERLTRATTGGLVGPVCETLPADIRQLLDAGSQVNPST